jgi:hypothetical protein
MKKIWTLEDIEQLSEQLDAEDAGLSKAEIEAKYAPFIGIGIDVLRKLANDPNSGDAARREAAEALTSRGIPVDPNQDWRH